MLRHACRRDKSRKRLDGTDTFAAVTTSDTLDAGALADSLLAGHDVIVHGRWLEHGMFAMTNGGVAVSFGSSFGTVPSWSGSATWSGSMVGVDARTGERAAGDALIAVDDFADAHIDIEITGIVGANGDTWAALRWEDVPLGADGFTSSNANGFVAGLLFGPDHEEIGGVFERNSLRGAFGASLLPSVPQMSR